MASNRPWLIVIEIIASSPTLTSINLSANRGTLPIGIWDAIMNSPKVKTLSLARINIKDVRQAKRFYKVCTLLEKLELDNCIDIYYPFFTHDMHVLPECFPSLQEIKFFNTSGYDARNYFRLLELCPELKSLYWHGDIFSLFDFCDGMVAESTFSKLDSLEVRGCSLSHLDLYEFPKKLKNPLKKLAVPRSQFDWFIIENLEERHLQSLQELDISQCTRATSKDFIELLRTCPALTVFKAGILLASDINQDETWLCAKHLTVLHIFIQVDEEDPKTSSRRVFSCLAKLTSLQELDLRASRIEVEYQTQIASPLQLRLDHGLAQLSTLWYLKRLYFNEKEGQDMTMEEGKWIKEHWRMLQVFQGRPSQTPRVATQIRKLFREANARYHRRQPRK
ncbi:hypothetical protein BGX27_001535 [Mortierella sp. AM989]|nr:hypothetical protein BGX27_001535 [Mortierella sp. AM989]